MAPRTKEQQIAYNEKRRAEKRRAENAAKKLQHERTAPLKMDGIKAERIDLPKVPVVLRGGEGFKRDPSIKVKRDPATGAQVMTSDKGKASVAKAVKTTKAMAKHEKSNKGKIAPVNMKPKVVARVEPQKFAGKTSSAKLIKGVDKHDRVKPDTTRGAGHERLAGKVPKHDIKAQIKTLGADSLLPEPKQNARVVNPTMPAAYVRNGKPGAGMLRGKNYQATVTFTPEQFMELKDKAAFWNRSLAEQIRWCVVQQLKSV